MITYSTGNVKDTCETTKKPSENIPVTKKYVSGMFWGAKIAIWASKR